MMEKPTAMLLTTSFKSWGKKIFELVINMVAVEERFCRYDISPFELTFTPTFTVSSNLNKYSY